jgi:hypothetical protein
MMKRLFPILLISTLVFAQDHPSGTRITPPTIRDYQPRGLSRGMTTEMTLEGFNLAKAANIYFSEPGITYKIKSIKELPDLPDIRIGSNGGQSSIDVGPLPPRNQIVLEVTIPSSQAVGPVRMRVQTPLGSSPVATFLVEPFWGETPEVEPNDSPEKSSEVILPSILAGTIGRSGDQDVYKLKVTAGQRLTFENNFQAIGSAISPVIEILDSDQNVIKTYGYAGDRTQRVFAHTFDAAGEFYVRVSDYQENSGGFYRIKVGDFPVVTGVYPLGGQMNSDQTLKLATTVKPVVQTMRIAPLFSTDVLKLRAQVGNLLAFNETRLAVGQDPEEEASMTNGTLAAAQPIKLGNIVNGRITKGPQYFKFDAKKGQDLVFEVNARRLGSELDSVIDILTADGKPVERAVAQPVWETTLALRDTDSVNRGIRITSWNALLSGDYVMIDSEIVRVDELPHSPDEDIIFESFLGQRTAYFGTTAEGHAIDRPAYKVKIHPAGTKLPPNGMPIARLMWRNDDGGGPYGKDSYLRFSPPADGTYLLRLADVNNQGGENFAYRLQARAPRPDFRITSPLANPNLPVGGTIPVQVTAIRIDDFDGPIEVTLTDLPARITARPTKISGREDIGVVLLTATADAKLDKAIPMRLSATANIGGKVVTREFDREDPLRLISLMPKADITMTSETKEIELEPGSTAKVTVRVQRHNGFKGRVPVDVVGLPARVRTADVGLNGVLLNEDEETRTFLVEAFPTAQPGVDQLFYVGGRVETRAAGQQNSFFAPEPIRVRVVDRKVRVSSN